MTASCWVCCRKARRSRPIHLPAQVAQFLDAAQAAAEVVYVALGAVAFMTPGQASGRQGWPARACRQVEGRGCLLSCVCFTDLPCPPRSPSWPAP